MKRIQQSEQKQGPIHKAAQKQAKREPRLAGLIALVLCGMVGGMIFLASQTFVPQVSRAAGTVTPQGSYRQIETREGGVVRQVFVEDGDVVEAGQIVAELSHPDLEQELKVLEKDVSSFEDRIANFDAILRYVDLGREVSPDTIAGLAERGLEHAAARLKIYAASQNIRASSIEQLKETIAILENAAAFAEERAQNKSKDLSITDDLYKRGLSTLRELQSQKDRADDLKAAASAAVVQLAQAEENLRLAIAGRKEETLALQEEILNQLIDFQSRYDSMQTSLRAVADKIEHLKVVAPARGVIQSISFAGQGEVIEPGEALFELLPTRQSLVAEVRIPSLEIGHVQPDHQVSVTVDTFDVRRFGKVEGAIRSVSPAPLIDEQTGESYFRAFVELSGDHIGEGPFRRPLQSGMTVVAEMVTDEKTLLAYLLKPVERSLNKAFSER
ncbi:MAG: HlyD family type I secretion periplasmic adaptor subunit [Pseudomonadota bacterium]